MAKELKNPYKVRIGQVWREVDPRVKNRLVMVIAIRDGKACICPPEGKRITWASLKRFHGKRGGYSQEPAK